ncbi:hypothetical protein B9Z19DRAFT_1118288 [Tuber borchii]|uniref:Uncharacterized protein n=1 Tax=Tuber borchii TaxID=42251 RepID=A0A2T7A8W5_TUBBO|nr:hypothetical protein B9Z19DRAFT_1118288 [Tuber borchii]
MIRDRPPMPRIKHSTAHGIHSWSGKNQLYSASPMQAASPSPPPPPPPGYAQEARTTPASFPAITTPPDQNLGANPLICASKKTGSSTFLCTMYPILGEQQLLLSGNVARVIRCRRWFDKDVVRL